MTPEINMTLKPVCQLRLNNIFLKYLLNIYLIISVVISYHIAKPLIIRQQGTGLVFISAQKCKHTDFYLNLFITINYICLNVVTLFFKLVGIIKVTLQLS